MENLVSQQVLEKVYKGKKVFVTGHTGFKGSWLTALLYTVGAATRGYALDPEYENGLYNILKPLHFVDSIIADIRSKEELREAVHSFQPDYIFHLAAQPLVRRSYEIPAETFEVNVVGTANLLEIVKELKKKCALTIITTDKVYDNKEQHVLYHEEDMLGGYDPYSASKACTEFVVNSFRSSFFNINDYNKHQKSIATARAGNVIGGGDWSRDRILPDIIRALESNATIEVRNPNAVRPWQHVLEPLTGYLLLGAKLYEEPLNFSTAYNFGPDPKDHLTVGCLVELAVNIWGNGTWKDQSVPEQFHEAGLLQLSIEKVVKELKWIPKLTAVEAIKWTMDWYKKQYTEKADFTLEQIKNYLDK